VTSGGALRDGSVDADGGVYRKTIDDAGIRFLKADYIAIPDLGGQPVSFLPEYLDADTLSVLESPNLIGGDQHGGQGPPPVKAVFKVKEQDYSDLLLKLKERNMEEFRDEACYCVNGLFGVPKGELEDPLTRMITDSRPTNQLTK
jgi:hypothetical protein